MARKIVSLKKSKGLTLMCQPLGGIAARLPSVLQVDGIAAICFGSAGKGGGTATGEPKVLIMQLASFAFSRCGLRYQR
jgi:hypothetical protein